MVAVAFTMISGLAMAGGDTLLKRVVFQRAAVPSSASPGQEYVVRVHYSGATPEEIMANLKTEVCWRGRGGWIDCLLKNFQVEEGIIKIPCSTGNPGSYSVSVKLTVQNKKYDLRGGAIDIR
jgi:hypothetical protein